MLYFTAKCCAILWPSLYKIVCSVSVFLKAVQLGSYYLTRSRILPFIYVQRPISNYPYPTTAAAKDPDGSFFMRCLLLHIPKNIALNVEKFRKTDFFKTI